MAAAGRGPSLARAPAELPERLCPGAVFFDRDSVLNEDRNYVHRAEQFAWTPGAREAVKLVNDQGLYAFVATNQAGSRTAITARTRCRRCIAG